MISTGTVTVSATSNSNTTNRRRNGPPTYRRQSTNDVTEAEQVILFTMQDLIVGLICIAFFTFIGVGSYK